MKEVRKMRGGQNLKNLEGRKFGRLEVIVRKGSNKDRRALWECKCDCGNFLIIEGARLLSANTKSCGCLKKEGNNKKHGLRYHPIYTTWKNMKGRCQNSKRPDYKYYGGRGIKICEEWDSFEAFYNDMVDNWKVDLTIERINNNGNYERDNCRWATREEQMHNRNGYGTSKYKNVDFHKDSGKWQARITKENKRIYLGIFQTEEEAYKAILNA